MMRTERRMKRVRKEVGHEGEMGGEGQDKPYELTGESMCILGEGIAISRLVQLDKQDRGRTD